MLKVVQAADVEKKDITYEEYKKKNQKLAKKLYKMNFRERSKKILYCAEVLRFQYFYDGDVKRKIAAVHFCKDMFCPICMKRKSIDQGQKLNNYVGQLQVEGYNFLHLILTLKNSFDAKGMREKLWRSWRDLRRRKVLDFADGAYASMEVTYSESSGFHFHLHVLLATKLKLPLHRKEYEMLDTSIELAWLDITKDSFITKLAGAKNIKQFIKYIVKSDEVLSMNDKVLRELMEAMRGKKTYTKTGVFRGLDLGVEEIDEELEEEFICFEVYRWSRDDKCYIRRFEDIDFTELTVDEVKRRINAIKKRKRGKKDVKGSG